MTQMEICLMIIGICMLGICTITFLRLILERFKYFSNLNDTTRLIRVKIVDMKNGTFQNKNSCHNAYYAIVQYQNNNKQLLMGSVQVDKRYNINDEITVLYDAKTEDVYSTPSSKNLKKSLLFLGVAIAFNIIISIIVF